MVVSTGVEADSNFTKSAYDMSLLPASGMKNTELSSVVASISILMPRLSPRIVASPEAYTRP